MGQPQLIEDAAAELAHEPFEGILPAVEGGHEGHDDGSGLTGPEHVAQMDAAQGAFPGDEDQGAALFEGHVGGAVQQVGSGTGGDAGQAAHGAGADHHAVVLPGAAGRGGSQTGRIMADVGQGMQGGRGKAAFRFQHGMGSGRKDEVAFHVGQGSQMAQQTQGQGHAAGTADAYDDSFHKSS